MISSDAPLAPGWTDALDAARAWVPPTWDDPATSVLVVVPHPDDEAVMFGGLVARLAGRGTPVHVLAVTDGGAAYPGVIDEHQLAALRRDEQSHALDTLGVPMGSVLRLGLPDGSVADHEPTVRTAIAAMIDDVDIGMIVAPWRHDHHTDHEACGRAAHAVLHDRSVVESARSHAPLIGAFGLFWSLQRDPRPAGLGLAALDLSDAERQRKLAAIDCHRSQTPAIATHPSIATVDPVLGPDQLALCGWPREHYVIDLGIGRG
jgi:LmbE family N-acetylglucosaminyl deacetylase